MRRQIAFVAIAFLIGATARAAQKIDVPDDFPRFIVPGHGQEMDSLRQMFWLHYEHNGPQSTLWDQWIPMATLWPAVGNGVALDEMRHRWAAALSSRQIDDEGYVSTHQHAGHGNIDGWPFPLWNQSGGIGWHFSLEGQPFNEAFGLRVTDQKGFETNGIEDSGIDKDAWHVSLNDPRASITTPAISLDADRAVYIKLFWRTHEMDHANPFLEWTTDASPEFSADKRMHFATLRAAEEYWYSMIPVHLSPNWKNNITRLRINFDNPRGARLDLRFIISALDTRHDVNNPAFIDGCCTYFAWTRDLQFLRRNIQRMRLAMHYIIETLGTRKHQCIVAPWPGHDGRSGLEITPEGKKVLHYGRGIGNNYWDLMPFGGEDCLATIYAYNSMKRQAELEDQIAAHPEWNMPQSVFDESGEFLHHHAQEIREFGQTHFWTEKTGRFVGAIDCDGVAHDYGFTFVNLEAICYGFASDPQAKSILDWVSGKRIVDGDTSTGADIYHWRFAPRSTTRRNIDWYVFAWSAPESIRWGNQVQDGGAVLGFSYHDLMARLITLGPDDVASRLSDIERWFSEVQSAGGYREYYKDPARGTLQGANVPGGLGLDKEFVESILPPQVMLFGFLGFHPSADGFTVQPQLPQDWPSLTITRIHFQDEVLSITAKPDEVSVEGLSPDRWDVKRSNRMLKATRAQ